MAALFTLAFSLSSFSPLLLFSLLLPPLSQPTFSIIKALSSSLIYPLFPSLVSPISCRYVVLLFFLVSLVTAAKRSVSLIPFLFLRLFRLSGRVVTVGSPQQSTSPLSHLFLPVSRPGSSASGLQLSFLYSPVSLFTCFVPLLLLGLVSCFALRPSRLPSADSLCQVTTRRDSPCTLSSGDFAISLAAYIAYCLHAPPAPLFFHKHSLFNTLPRGNDLIDL